jgi:hypothetical protein
MTTPLWCDNYLLMPKFIFILGAPNASDGNLSSVSLSRIDAAIAKQRQEPDSVIVATGGFGAHFNSTETPHREYVHRRLEAEGAVIDRAEAGDLLSSNTVEDIGLIVAFTESRSVDEYCIVTSQFHAARCHFIIDCLAAKHTVEVLAADDPLTLPLEAREHEDRSLRQLSAQGGVVVGTVLHSHPTRSK